MRLFNHALLVVILLHGAAPAFAQRAVILVRHADKETEPAKLAGLDDDEIPLSTTGKARANALASALADAGVTAIYTSTALRTKATARPLADQLKITTRILDDDSLEHLAKRDRDGVVLIVGHTNTVPDIIDKLMKRKCHIVIGEKEFDRIFVLFRKGDESFGLVRARY